MADKELLPVFQDAKETLCKYDYYIHTSKRILHLTNTEEKIPHLMGLQYIGAEKFTGDSGAYLIKKGRLKRKSIEAMTTKLYRRKSLRESILSMIYGKIDNIDRIKDMFCNASVLYLYDTKKNPESEFKTDYLMVYQTARQVFQLGLVKSKTKEKNLCHCNSFIVTYTSNNDYDQYYRNLQNRYEILKIVREEKSTKKSEVIYQSKLATARELGGIEKMMQTAGSDYTEKILKMILRINIKFGKYHTIEMLNDTEALIHQCTNPREKKLVTDFLKLWKAAKDK